MFAFTFVHTVVFTTSDNVPEIPEESGSYPKIRFHFSDQNHSSYLLVKHDMFDNVPILMLFSRIEFIFIK